MTLAFLWHWFDFPNGSVLTNLVASAVVVGFGAWRLFKHLKGLHAHLDVVHAHVREVHEHVKLVHEHQVAMQPKRRRT